MYLPLWTILVIISLVISVAAFFWGLSAGQFSNADRARYLPFTGKEPGPTSRIDTNMKLPLEVYILGGVVFVGVIIFGFLVLLTIYNLWTG